MAFKVFLDINIMIDLLDANRPEHLPAKQLFEAIERKKVKAHFSESVINTTAYIIRKSIKIADFKDFVIDLLMLIKVLPCTNTVVKEAYTNAKNDLEDAVLYQIALEHKIDYFLTNNNKDFQKLANEDLPVVSAKQLLELI
ncbi:MAG: type II toxin-antitoxin system VapC family toxin [Janthinobacterium lividum]